VPIALLAIVVAIIAFYLVAGVIRYLRQEFQPPRNTKNDPRDGPTKR